MELLHERHILEEMCRKPSCLIALRRAVVSMSYTGIDAACGAGMRRRHRILATLGPTPLL